MESVESAKFKENVQAAAKSPQPLSTYCFLSFPLQRLENLDTEVVACSDSILSVMTTQNSVELACLEAFCGIQVRKGSFRVNFTLETDWAQGK